MEKKKMFKLLEKVESGAATTEEIAQYNQLYMSFQKSGDWDTNEMGEKEDIGDEMYTNISQAINDSTKGARSYSLLRYAAAAVLFIAVSAGYYFHKLNSSVSLKENSKTLISKNDIAPGGNKATLTLGNGTKISLTDAANGDLVKQSGISIIKTVEGQLVYKVSGESNGKASAEFNTITTPNGGQYHVLLPDGSKVWLNAASSLKFPTFFAGADRKVELNGEAYFEVAKNKNMPFTVDANGTKVLVLGTHFNVMAYKDENDVKTTLLEGSVKLSHADAVAFLRPGQQGSIAKKGGEYKVREADLASVMAWKNGYFLFDNASLPELMRQISRWYDVDVVYAPGLKDHEFVGEVKRSYSLVKVLRILELSDVKFKLEGRTLIVK
jgi:transmembrane sensor